MCVFHKFCIICFCVYLLSQTILADNDVNPGDGHPRGKEINETSQTISRDQNVKNVIHVHKHYDQQIIGNISDNSLEEGLHYVRMIFEKFGDRTIMRVEDLEDLFLELQFWIDHDNHTDDDHEHTEHIGEHDHNEHQHGESDHEHGEHDHSEHDEHEEGIGDGHHMNGTEHDHEEHVHNEMKNLNKSDNEINNEESEKLEKNRHKRNTVKPHLENDHTECLDIQSILKVYHLEKEKYFTSEQFLHLSPAFIYQLNNVKCRITHTGHVHTDGETSASGTVGFVGIPGAVWGYSTLAVIIISLVGLLGVAVIPIMQKVLYNHLLQFLVAMAVGALTGDALLHLLPHAIIGEGVHHDSHGHGSHGDHKLHQSAVLKGLCGLAGLFFFFLMERVLTIFTNIKRKRKQSKRRTLSPKQKTECKDDGKHIAKKLSAYDESDYQSCEEMIMVVHPNKSLKGYADETHDKVFHTSHDACHPKDNKHSHSNVQTAEEEGMLSLPHSHSGHSHHAHCEMLTNSVASVAWMVILGDGIHNFSDGLAIGAAFANSITGGVSTSIAVFCHELPHEIGDFAVLLRAGMSIKQAIVYNILSSVMCFIGMLIGVAIGNIHEASQWIFAVVAGMFIYIATVDMLPEMTSVDTKQGEHPFFHLFLQCIGMIFGAGIMLLIAFFEEDLLTALDG